MAELDKILIQTHSDVILEECPKLIAGNEVKSEFIDPLCLIPILPYFRTESHVSLDGSDIERCGSNVEVPGVTYH